MTKNDIMELEKNKKLIIMDDDGNEVQIIKNSNRIRINMVGKIELRFGHGVDITLL